MSASKTPKPTPKPVSTGDTKKVTMPVDEVVKGDYAVGRQNYYLIIIGFLIIIVGFLLMVGGGSDDPNVFNEKELFSFRRITLAPIIVLFGFFFQIWAIMKRPKE